MAILERCQYPHSRFRRTIRFNSTVLYVRQHAQNVALQIAAITQLRSIVNDCNVQYSGAARGQGGEASPPMDGRPKIM